MLVSYQGAKGPPMRGFDWIAEKKKWREMTDCGR
jgi:hypothetical protein